MFCGYLLTFIYFFVRLAKMSYLENIINLSLSNAFQAIGLILVLIIILGINNPGRLKYAAEFMNKR